MIIACFRPLIDVPRFHVLFFWRNRQQRLRAPIVLHPMHFFLHRGVACCRDHCPLPHSRIHSSLFRQNRNAFFRDSTSGLCREVPSPAPSPVVRTCQQSFVSTRH